MCGFVIGNIFTDEKQFRDALSLIDHRGSDSKGVRRVTNSFQILGWDIIDYQFKVK